MKKLVLFVFLMMSLSLVFAELVVDIPFDLNIVGDSFAINGAYTYESDWITVSNTGSSNQDYTIMYSTVNVPTGWTMSICDDTGMCFMPNSPGPFAIPAGESILIHIIINVSSTDGFDFPLTFGGGDLTEPLVFEFTFDTADNVSADDELIIPQKLSQNFPNPFNPSTSISYQLSSNEMQFASIEIFNVKGQIVKTYNQLNGNSITWKGTDNNGAEVDSGIYFYQLRAQNAIETRKMILLK